MHAISILVDGRREFVPCGKCNFCLESRRAEWSFRLRQEHKVSSSSHFLTLTYEKPPINSEGFETLCKRDLQLFIKRLRKASKKKLRYYAVGEYGSKTERPHYHALLFNCESKLLAESLASLWNLGHTMVGSVTDASIHYVTKYHVNKFGEYPGRDPPFVLMSRRPGIGANYLETHAQWHLSGLRAYTQVNGQLGKMPRYYVDKLFSKEQKELIKMQAPKTEKQLYYEELERLSKLHQSPAEYYAEQLRHKHDSIKHKDNSHDKI